MLRPQRVWRAIFGPYPVDTAYKWRGTPLEGRPFLRVAHFGDCAFREMPLSHGIHTRPGYPRVMAERLEAAGLGMEFSSMMVSRYEDLPQSEDALTTYLKLTGDPDVVIVQSCAQNLRLEILPSTHGLLRMREDIGRALGRHIFTGYRLLRPVQRALGHFAIPYEGTAALRAHLRAVQSRWPEARIAVLPPFERSTARRQNRLWHRINDETAAAADAAGATFVDPGDLVPAARPEFRCPNGSNLNAEGTRLVGDRLADWVLAAVPEHQLAGAVEGGLGRRRAGDEVT